MRLRPTPGPAGTSWVPTGSLWGETEAVPVPGIAEAVGLAEAIALHDVPAQLFQMSPVWPMTASGSVLGTFSLRR